MAGYIEQKAYFCILFYSKDFYFEAKYHSPEYKMVVGIGHAFSIFNDIASRNISLCLSPTQWQ